MVLSQGLLISLGFTLVIGILLFVFIRQKTSSIENKIDTLFQLVHEEAEKQHKMKLEMQQSAANAVLPVLPAKNIENSQNNIVAEIEEQERLTVSDDSESDLESESSIGSVSEGNDELIIDNGSITTSSVTTNDSEDIEDINVKGELENDDKSLKYHSSEDSNISEPEDLPESDSEDSVLDMEELKSVNLGSSSKVDINNEIDYKKKTVAELRDMVIEYGLSDDPKKIKKGELVDMLKEYFSKQVEEVEVNKIESPVELEPHADESSQSDNKTEHQQLKEILTSNIEDDEEEINMNEVD